MPVCKKCNLPISFKKIASGKWCPTNPDGSDHWDLCSETRFKNNPNKQASKTMAFTWGKDFVESNDDSVPWSV